jgi:hypothetical protein
MNDVWYNLFVESLYKKHPKKSQLVEALMDLLCLEREAVYRRLRKEVIFTIHEIVKISSVWDISLDEIIGNHKGAVSFMMKSINYVDPSEDEMVEIKKRVQRLEHLETSSTVECMEICNKLPRSLTIGFPSLYQFDVFRWAYQYGNTDGNLSFSQISFTEEFLQELTNYSRIIKHVANMNYIWDYKIFEYLVNDVQYFHSIFLVTDEEKERIKNELMTLLDYLLEVANRGYFPETNNKVNLYISKVNIGTNYSYFYTDELKLCRIHVFEKFDIFSFNSEMVNDFRTWMQLKKRTSIQISEVDERSRIEFFMQQRELVNSL